MSSIGTSFARVCKNDDTLKQAAGPWLNYAKTGSSFPYAVYSVRPGKSVASFGGHLENQYNVELQTFALTDTQAATFLAAMDAAFHFTKFAMAAPEQCMSSLHERPGEVSQAGRTPDNKPVFRARCVYLVRVFIPAS